MDLFNFQKYIDNKILDRGWEYYQHNSIKSITKENENTYTAIVAGTDDYSVEVQLGGNNDIVYSHCDCPYDLGPYCKHEVAVFYALREMLERDQDYVTADSTFALPARPVKSKKKVPAAKESPYDRFTSIISAQSKDKLVQFLVSLSLEDDAIGRRVELEFGADDGEQEYKKCIALIRSYIRQYRDRHGFVSYQETSGAAEGAWMVLERAEQAKDNGDYKRALHLYLCILHEMVPLLQSADDSGGFIGAVIDESISALQSLAQANMPDDAQQHLFQKILRESSNKIYNGWPDWRLGLLEACAQLTVTTERRKIFEKHLDSFMNEFDGSWSSRYLTERMAMIRYQLTLKFAGEKMAAEFMEQNISFPLFREMAIKKALSQKEYDRAERLALDGEQHDKGMPGLVNKWKELRYEAYRLSGQIDKQRSLAIELIMAGSFDYYKKLKATYAKDEWVSVYPSIIKALEKQKGYSGNYTNILIEEGELHKLLDYVKTKPVYITEYYQHLLPTFSNEVYHIFVQYILDEAKRANNRSGYRKVCSYIRLLANIGGKEHARQVTDNLLATYPRRPAFREELRKIRF